jgi:hypothetical protein
MGKLTCACPCGCSAYVSLKGERCSACVHECGLNKRKGNLMRRIIKPIISFTLCLLMLACSWTSIADEVVSSSTDLVNFERSQGADTAKYEAFQKRATEFRDALKAALTPEGKIALAPLLSELVKDFRTDFLPSLQVKNPFIAFALDSALRRLSEHFVNQADKVKSVVARAAAQYGSTPMSELREYLGTAKVEKPK